MKTKELKEEFIKEFWEWFRNYHEKRYSKEGKMLTPSYHYHQKYMKFDNYAWDWVALFVKECYIKNTNKKKGEIELR